MIRKIDVLLGLPQLLDAPWPEPHAFYRWQHHFLWQTDHCFRLSVSGTAGVYRAESHGQAEAAEASLAGAKSITAHTDAAALLSGDANPAANVPADSAAAASRAHDPVHSAGSA